ncbi:MAG TPA: hypothetical protein VH440_05030 [Candidatus Limnocylindrales bacterium]
MAVQATGIEAQSYETDAALLEELRAGPPIQGVDGPGLPPAGAVRLTDRFAVALLDTGDGGFASVPILRWGFAGWRRAVAGDGLSAFVAGVPLASERAIGVDQTHESVVVGERAIVKWFRTVGPSPSRATLLLGHLAAVGYRGIPQPLGSIAWRSPAGIELTIAQGDAFLAGARDGWEWVVERAEAGPETAISTGRELGRLVAGLHRALALPSPLIAGPFGVALAADVDAWRSAAVATLEQALALTDGADGEELRGWAPAMRAAIDPGVATDSAVPIQPIHGDLHVGQVLEWSRGLAVIDFDGNPALGADGNVLRQPIERDVAQMLSSLDHVGRVVEHRRGGDPDGGIRRWIAAARRAFLEVVRPANAGLLEAFEVEQECRELVYAARFLPSWRFAPMATLRARFAG